MKSRFHLLNTGLFPETLPPCFVSNDAKRSFHGIVAKLDEAKFHERKSDFIRFNSTKHDGSRRFFGTPNIVSYFHISSFIWKNWKEVSEIFARSSFALGAPRVLEPSDERAIQVPSLSELSRKASERLRYAPFILQADIAQCFPSIYTHSICWAAHGIEESKGDTDRKSEANYFNALDFFVRNAQRGNTRGVLIGPDAYRICAELVLSAVDAELNKLVGGLIVGAVRHVDDYYIGLRSEHDAQSVLSHLREVLGLYTLNLNDHKTRIYSSMEPINDLWAQRLRDHMDFGYFGVATESFERAVSEAAESAREQKSDSPMKILLRSLDDAKIYSRTAWEFAEGYLQRIVQKYPHALDYACLITAKRAAIGQSVDKSGWLAVAETVIARSLALNHHHEVVWMIWLLVVCDIEISEAMVEELSKSRNAHIRSLIVQAYVDKKIAKKPKLSLGAKISTTDDTWLVNLVAKSQGFTGAAFSGDYASEFDHLAKRHIKLIDFDGHAEKVRESNVKAISRLRYGYDDEGAEHENQSIFSAEAYEF